MTGPGRPLFLARQSLKQYYGSENVMEYNYRKICYEIARQDIKTQDDIMQFLKSNYTEEECKCLFVGIAYCRLYIYPELKAAMMDAISSELYKTWKKWKEQR